MATRWYKFAVIPQDKKVTPYLSRYRYDNVDAAREAASKLYNIERDRFILIEDRTEETLEWLQQHNEDTGWLDNRRYVTDLTPVIELPPAEGGLG